jgi:hypothetical protein
MGYAGSDNANRRTSTVTTNSLGQCGTLGGAVADANLFLTNRTRASCRAIASTRVPGTHAAGRRTTSSSHAGRRFEKRRCGFAASASLGPAKEAAGFHPVEIRMSAPDARVLCAHLHAIGKSDENISAIARSTIALRALGCAQPTRHNPFNPGPRGQRQPSIRLS